MAKLNRTQRATLIVAVVAIVGAVVARSTTNASSDSLAEWIGAIVAGAAVALFLSRDRAR